MNWKKLHFYAHTFCRYYLATMILSYAIAKILGTQFTSEPSTYDKPVGLLSGFDLTWYFYGYSFWYGVFIAISQIVSALLLFFRQTTRVGIVLFLSFMVNIMLLDYAYNVDGAKFSATLMTVMGIFIFLSEYPLFIRYFLIEAPLFQDKDRPDWINKFSKLKWVYIPLVVVGFFVGLSAMKEKYMGKNQFYGTWRNIDSTANFKYFNFEAANSFKINGIHNIDLIESGQCTFTNDVITLRTFTKEYQQLLANNTDPDVFLHPDTTKLITILKGRYQLSHKELVIQGDSTKITLTRVR